MFACRELLRKIAPERIREELCKLLCGPAAGRILREYRSVLEVFLPEIRSMYGFRQNTPYHAYDVWEHTVRALEAAPARPVYRLAMLCHDMGKPARYTVDGRGQGHFHGHPAESERLAVNILRRLRFDHKTAAAVCELIRFHDYRLEPSAVLIRKLLALLGPERLQQLLNVQRADAAGKADEAAAEQTARVNAAAGVLDEVLARGDCYTLRGLQIGGGDLLAIGVPSGPQIGTLLQKLLDEVIEDRLENDREALRRRAAVMMQERTQKEQA